MPKRNQYGSLPLGLLEGSLEKTLPPVDRGPLLIQISATVLSTFAICLLIPHHLVEITADAAWHYTIVDYLSEFWCSIADFRTLHPNMGIYPPLTHAIAAVVGTVVGSSFLGMSFTAALFTCATYAILLEGIRSSDLRQTTLSICLFLIGFTALRHFNLTFGAEVVRNYFFAQLGSNVAALLTIFVFSERQRSFGEVATIPAIVFLVGWVYPLAQVEILVGTVVLWIVTIVRSRFDQKQVPTRMVVAAVSITVLGTLAIRFHPVYQHMRIIANNNGAGSFDVVPMLALAVMSVALFAASVTLYVQPSRLVHRKFLGTAGTAIACSFGLHYGSFLVFGSGSPYGVR
ncbi:hypothetical protein ACQR1Q_36540, partial [Bradyrhizobium oligotrophicum]|uniref:hypothetical protein n=1 Tax=Bradyrhizobium oligotrophicum TaxID=44255 RepID=UPI003EC05F58